MAHMLMLRIEASGCPQPRISCSECKNDGRAGQTGFDGSVTVCLKMPNNIDPGDPQKVIPHITSTVLHELIHSLDTCNGAPPPENMSCEQLLCAESRAYSCSDQCSGLATERLRCMRARLVVVLNSARFHNDRCPEEVGVTPGIVGDAEFVDRILRTPGCTCHRPCSELNPPPELPPILRNG